MTSDSYHTLAGPAGSHLQRESSKFLAYAYPVESEGGDSHAARCAAQEILRRDAPLLRVALGPHGETFRANDDGEPSGTAGKPILGQLLSNELVNCLIVVVALFRRYETRSIGPDRCHQGVGGRSDPSGPKSWSGRSIPSWRWSFSYLAMNDVMRVVRGRTAPVLTQQFDKPLPNDAGYPAKSRRRYGSAN